MNTVIDFNRTVPTELPKTASKTEDFRIESESGALWYLRKMATIETEIQRITSQAEAMVKELRNDADRLNHLYGSQLEQWARLELIRRGGRSKTVRTLQGNCAFRTVPATLRVTDKVAALKFAEENLPDLVQTKIVTTLDVDGYHKIAEATGEVLPGISFTPERETFLIRFGKSE